MLEQIIYLHMHCITYRSLAQVGHCPRLVDCEVSVEGVDVAGGKTSHSDCCLAFCLARSEGDSRLVTIEVVHRG